MKVRSPDGDTNYFDIAAEVLQGDTLAPYFLITCLDYVLRTSIDKIKENGFEQTKKRSRRMVTQCATDSPKQLFSGFELRVFPPPILAALPKLASPIFSTILPAAEDWMLSHSYVMIREYTRMLSLGHFL